MRSRSSSSSVLLCAWAVNEPSISRGAPARATARTSGWGAERVVVVILKNLASELVSVFIVKSPGLVQTLPQQFRTAECWVICISLCSTIFHDTNIDEEF